MFVLMIAPLDPVQFSGFTFQIKFPLTLVDKSLLAAVGVTIKRLSESVIRQWVVGEKKVGDIVAV